MSEGRTIHELDCCPRCGGKSGFSYKLTIRGTQTQMWKGSDREGYFEHDHTTGHGAYRCDDCSQIIKPKHISQP